MRAALLALLASLLAAPTLAAPSAEALEEEAVLAESQAAIGRQVADLAFVDSNGKPVRLRDLRGQPVVVNLIYTSCGDFCPTVVETLGRAVAAADAAFGRGRFAVVTAGFDTRHDTPRQLHDYAAAHGIDRAAWLLLSGDNSTLDRLAADTGFRFRPRAGGFDHTGQVTLLDQDQRVYRQIYGDNFPTQALVEPLKQLLYGGREDAGLRGLMDRIRLLCTTFDPATGAYRFSYAIVFEIGIGALCLALVAVFGVRLWTQTDRA